MHKDNLDRPRARFGCEVALRFLAPSNPASRVTPHRFAEFLRQEWYLPLKEWDQFTWEATSPIECHKPRGLRVVS